MAQNPEHPVIAVSYTNPFSAQAARLALDREGIDCFLSNEAQAAYTGMGMVTVDLMVRADQRDDARRVLQAADLL